MHGVRAAGEVDGGLDQGLVEGNQGVAEAGDARLVAEGLAQRLAECQRGVLHGVVPAGRQVAADRHFEVEATVTSEQVEHVVKEADARHPRSSARAVEVERQRYARFAGRPRDLGSPGHGDGFSTMVGMRARIDSACIGNPSASAIAPPALASAASATGSIRTSAIWRRNIRAESPEENRAEPAVGRMWLEPAT